MLHTQDTKSAPSSGSWIWLNSREAPRPIHVGDMGTIADAEPGDVVVAERGGRYALLLIAFRVPGGFDDRHAFAYVQRGWSLGPHGHWTQASDRLRGFAGSLPVRFLGLRPAFERRRK